MRKFVNLGALIRFRRKRMYRQVHKNLIAPFLAIGGRERAFENFAHVAENSEKDPMPNLSNLGVAGSRRRRGFGGRGFGGRRVGRRGIRGFGGRRAGGRGCSSCLASGCRDINTSFSEISPRIFIFHQNFAKVRNTSSTTRKIH